MRYFLAGLAMLLAVSSWAADNYNESVAAISYNPSRLGAYKHLKVAQKATLSGIDATNATVNILTKGGTVEVKNNSYTGTGSHQIESVVPMPDVDSCASYSSLCNRNNNDATTYLEAENGVIAGNPASPYEEGDLPAISINTTWPFTSGQGTTLNLNGGTLAVSNSNTKVFIGTIGTKLTNLNLDASATGGKLIMGSGKQITVNTTFKLGQTTITANGSYNCSKFVWWTRNDEGGSKAKILTCQKS